MVKKIILPSLQRIIELFTQKICHEALKNMSLGTEIPGSEIPGSGMNLFRIRVQGSKRHLIPDPDP